MKQPYNVKATLQAECPPDFVTHPKPLDGYNDVDNSVLRQACDNFKALVADPDALQAEAHKLLQASYFPVEELKAALDATQGAYVRVYYGVHQEDTETSHFMFMAPADTNGNAIDGKDIIFPQCIGPNPPCGKGVTAIKDMFMGD
ncbi:hypothetical protein [Fibrella forsythiae]|uniref:Uncharacterized protein n=1 Tax=Fibrella forsythiae TaxID=2817061 RepID=A0ABS3JLW6_9BACT|nr:hypothetical protein [Fibrella forsythiae]MBO0950989.1 hypothetical protein [Fibrella forsythiae]